MLTEGPLRQRAQQWLLAALPERLAQAATWLVGLVPLLAPLTTARREALVPPLMRLIGLVGFEVAAVDVVSKGL